MWHHQDKGASGSRDIRLGDLQAEDCNVQQQKTRIISQDYEEIQYCNWRDRNYNHIQKNKFSTYPTMRRRPTRIWQSSKLIHRHDKRPPNLHQYGFTCLLFTISDLTNQKRAMPRAMSKPWDLPMKIFSTWLIELNNFLPLFPGSRVSKKTPL